MPLNNSTENLENQLVSIIIPSYNSGRFLRRSLESALAQTYKNIEIIVIDDGSTDDTAEIAQRFGNRVRYHHQENKGLSRARNTALNLAQGSYIQFLDADDTIDSRKVEIQYHFLNEHPDVDVVYSDYEVVDSNGSEIPGEAQRLTLGGFSESYDLFDAFLRAGVFVPHCPLSRTNAIRDQGGFDDNSRCFEDWDLWLRMLLGGSRFQYLPGTTAKYYKHGSAMTDNGELLHEGRQWLLEKFSQDERLQKMPEKLKDFRAYQQRALGDNHYNQREWAEARRYYRASLQERWDAGVGVLIAKTLAHEILPGK